MGERLIEMKVNLDISARRMLNQFRLDNQAIESQVEKGINQAIEEICNKDNFVELVKENTKKEILELVNRTVLSWNIREKISKSLQEALDNKLSSYADSVAEKITNSLDNKPDRDGSNIRWKPNRDLWSGNQKVFTRDKEYIQISGPTDKFTTLVNNFGRPHEIVDWAVYFTKIR